MGDVVGDAAFFTSPPPQNEVDPTTHASQDAKYTPPVSVHTWPAAGYCTAVPTVNEALGGSALDTICAAVGDPVAD